MHDEQEDAQHGVHLHQARLAVATVEAAGLAGQADEVVRVVIALLLQCLDEGFLDVLAWLCVC